MTNDEGTVYVRFARKPGDLESVQHCAGDPSVPPCRAHVVKANRMTGAEYDRFTSSLRQERDWLAGQGGWLDRETRAVVEVSAPGREPLFIDPQGYAYPRYVGMRSPRLPPDPEGMNDRRAAWAERAVAAFIEETGTDRGDAVTDLLCDLMHWCDRNDREFSAALTRAGRHYSEETEGETSTKEGE